MPNFVFSNRQDKDLLVSSIVLFNIQILHNCLKSALIDENPWWYSTYQF